MNEVLIHCRDCLHFISTLDGETWCAKRDVPKNEDEYCDFAKAKKGGGTGVKRYILTVGDDNCVTSVEEFTTCRDCGAEPLPMLGNLACLIGDKRTDFLCRLRGNTIFRCRQDSEVIRRYYSRYRVEKILPMTDSAVVIDLDYPIGEEENHE